MIPEAFHAAVLATLITALVYGFLLSRLCAREDRFVLIAATGLGFVLPILLVSLFLFPFERHVRPHLGSVVVAAWILLSAPLIEEPAKWLVLLSPPVRRTLRPDNAGAIALALGLGFALGEAWTQTYALWSSGETRPALWIYLGYAIDRLGATMLHGGFVLFVAKRLTRGRPLWPGMLLGVSLHFLVNFAVFFHIGPAWPWLHAAWPVVSYLVPLAVLVFLGMVMARALGPGLRRLILGKPIACPSCSEVYERPWLAFNCGTISYERCPHCRTLQWVRPPAKPRGTLSDAPG
jgi:RsiW-degrading membrane proteinase PrsW (M82 family)